VVRPAPPVGGQGPLQRHLRLPRGGPARLRPGRVPGRAVERPHGRVQPGAELRTERSAAGLSRVHPAGVAPVHFVPVYGSPRTSSTTRRPRRPAATPMGSRSSRGRGPSSSSWTSASRSSRCGRARCADPARGCGST
jgi:hypothetical protein